MEFLTDGLMLANTIASIVNILYVAIGLGLVIFFHELGHFAVAKWCGVYVENFSIGFGPAIWSFKWGDTVYALRAVPLGGYVQMLGQDDADPSQLTSEEIAANPRSYSSKKVWQRMAIISAGVIMNLITGTIFCSIAYMFGVLSDQPRVGSVEPGMPAWTAGLRTGDKITKLDGRTVRSFDDIKIGAILSMGDLPVEGVHDDGTPFRSVMRFTDTKKRPTIGVGMYPSLTVEAFRDYDFASLPGTAADSAEPKLLDEDRILSINGEELNDFNDLREQLVRRIGQPITAELERKPRNPNGTIDSKGKPQVISVTIPPSFFRSLGMSMDTGPITALRDDSPGVKAGFKKGDKIVEINGRAIGTDLDPLKLPDEFSRLAGQDVTVIVARQTEGGGNHQATLTVVPESRPGWLDAPLVAGDPLSIPAIGVAFQVVPVVVTVDPQGPAAAAGIKPGTRILNVTLEPEGGEKPAPDVFGNKALQIKLDDEKDMNNWAYAFAEMQRLPLRRVKLTMKGEGLQNSPIELVPVVDESWPAPLRGINLGGDRFIEKSGTIGEAFQMGFWKMQKSVLDIYATLRSLVMSRLSMFDLHGPVGIARAAYIIAKQGIPALLIFLGFLSANLAVINFLPIPMLDGGHMVFLIYEGITGRKPNAQVQIIATYIGITFVLGLMVFVLSLDLFVHKF